MGMPNRQTKIDALINEHFVQQARDALIYLELVSGSKVYAELRGLITKVRSHGGIIFFVLEDATSSIQLVAYRNQFNDNDWEELRLVRKSHRVVAKGIVGRSKTGEASIVLNEPLIRLEGGNIKDDERTIKDLDRVGVRLFLSRLRYKSEVFFRSNNFLQIEPNFISTSWDIRGIEPLRVQYEGFGVPTFLTPSPSPQLLAVMETTGADKVFAIGRCFTTTYRDETTSAESLILMAKVASATIDEIASLSVKALEHILGDRETMPENYPKLMEKGWVWSNPEKPPLPGGAQFTVPTIQIYGIRNNTAKPLDYDETTVLRVCWPPKFVLIEGSIRKISGQKGIGTMTIFLERIVPLLKNVSLRQLEDLQRTEE